MSKIHFKNILVLSSLIVMSACASAQRTEESTDVVPPPAPATETSAAPEPSLPQATSSAEPPASPSMTGNGTPQDYTVKSGDTLMKIAFQFYGDLLRWKEIYDLNRDRINNPNAIRKGQVIKVVAMQNNSADESGETYTIKEGDTLGKISNSLYGTPTKWKILWEQNKQLIQNPNKIFAGFNIRYAPEPGVTPSAEAQSAAPQVNQGTEAPPVPSAAPAPKEGSLAAGIPNLPTFPASGADAGAPAAPTDMSEAPSPPSPEAMDSAAPPSLPQ